MNEREKAEFEHHKKAAEEQFHKMYYGNGGKSQNKGGFTMPSFLAAPKQQNGNVKSTNSNPLKVNSEEKNPNKSLNENKKTSSKNDLHFGNNILNLLNFKGMKMDNDRLVILAICLLLAGEETDELLMLALMYIML